MEDEKPIKFELIPISSTEQTKDFDQFLSEIVISEIPMEYIEKIKVEYQSGKVSEIHKKDIKRPMPLSKIAKRLSNYSKIDKISIYLDNERLNFDLENETQEILDKSLNFPRNKP